MSGWSLDHVFFFVAPPGPNADPPELSALAALGLAESFRRPHPGQGTANACFCFDNAYLELLWIADRDEAATCGLARCDLLARAGWRRTGASPFGIALSHEDPAAEFPFPHWHYRPSYLPPGMSIPVATASDDPRQPLLFRSPGNARPDQWTDGRAGARQRETGITEIAALDLILPAEVTPDPAWDALAAQGLLTLDRARAAAVEIALSRADGTRRSRLRLPDCALRQADPPNLRSAPRA